MSAPVFVRGVVPYTRPPQRRTLQGNRREVRGLERRQPQPRRARVRNEPRWRHLPSFLPPPLPHGASDSAHAHREQQTQPASFGLLRRPSPAGAAGAKLRAWSSLLWADSDAVGFAMVVWDSRQTQQQQQPGAGAQPSASRRVLFCSFLRSVRARSCCAMLLASLPWAGWSAALLLPPQRPAPEALIVVLCFGCCSTNSTSGHGEVKVYLEELAEVVAAAVRLPRPVVPVVVPSSPRFVRILASPRVRCLCRISCCEQHRSRAQCACARAVPRRSPAAGRSSPPGRGRWPRRTTLCSGGSSPQCPMSSGA